MLYPLSYGRAVDAQVERLTADAAVARGLRAYNPRTCNPSGGPRDHDQTPSTPPSIAPGEPGRRCRQLRPPPARVQPLPSHGPDLPRGRRPLRSLPGRAGHAHRRSPASAASMSRPSSSSCWRATSRPPAANRYAGLRAFFGWAVDEGEIKESPDGEDAQAAPARAPARSPHPDAARAPSSPPAGAMTSRDAPRHRHRAPLHRDRRPARRGGRPA